MGNSIYILAIIAVLILVQLNRSAKKEAKAARCALFDMAIEELIRREGFSEEPYLCPAGHLTVGIGNRTDSHERVTFDEAYARCVRTLQDICDTVSRKLPGHTRSQVMAVALLAHNLGLNRLMSSPQWKRIVEKTPDCEEYWLRYCWYKSGGIYRISDNLVKAREFEVSLWRMGK